MRLLMELESLVVPEADASEEAGNLVQRLPELWLGANLQERHKLLVSMLEAVYVDHKDAKAVVAIQPKPAFRAVFQVAITRAGSAVILIKEPPEPSQKATSPCSWWRRGRVDLYHEHGLGVVLMVATKSPRSNAMVAVRPPGGVRRRSCPFRNLPCHRPLQ